MRPGRLLLAFYPASFRAEYGPAIREVHAERLRRARGPAEVLRIQIASLADAAWHGAAAHLDLLRQDGRAALRGFARAPGYASLTILVAALGVGATTAAFSALDHVLIRPLPFPEPDRLVVLWQDQSHRGYPRMELSPPNFRDWRRMSRSFSAMGAHTGASVNLVGAGDPRRLDGSAVTADVFSVLGARAALGRVFTPDDEAPGSEATVIVSDAVWRSHFAADPDVVGRIVRLDGDPTRIIGVMPRGFAYPSRDHDFWLPLRISEGDAADRNNYFLRGIARLRPGVSVAAARAELRGIAAVLEREYPTENARTGATVLPLAEDVPRQSRLLLAALFGASLTLLLIACANLASLSLARGVSRRRELAVRAALGAGPERLRRQLLTESALLAAAGGILGAALAAAATPLAARLIPTSFPVAELPSANPRMLAFALVLTAATAVGFGLLPALRGCRDAGSDALRESSRTGADPRGERLRGALVVAEIAASVALLITTGLLLRALWRLQAVDPGFRPDGVLTLRTSLASPEYRQAERRRQFYDRVLADVRALPGVVEAAYTSWAPLAMGGGIWPVGRAGVAESPADTRAASLRFVTPGYFGTLRIPILSGRRLEETDVLGALDVAVVSRSFAEQNFPGQDPVGRAFRFALRDRTVVGVAADVRVRGLERVAEPQVYLPSAQLGDDELSWYVPKDLLVRAASPGALVPAIREIVGRADPGIPVSDVRMLADLVTSDTAPRRTQARALAGFAAAALILAALGVHGLLAFTVSRREREIGVRVALGARISDVLSLVFRRGLVLALSGLAAGAVLAYAAGRSLQALLFGVSPADGVTFLAVGGIVVAAALLGSLAPALRAARLDPMQAIRSD